MQSKSRNLALLKDQIAGLAFYLKAAEVPRLNALNPPEEDLALYAKLLSYASALELEEAADVQAGFAGGLLGAGFPATDFAGTVSSNGGALGAGGAGNGTGSRWRRRLLSPKADSRCWLRMPTPNAVSRGDPGMAPLPASRNPARSKPAGLFKGLTPWLQAGRAGQHVPSPARGQGGRVPCAQAFSPPFPPSGKAGQTARGAKPSWASGPASGHPQVHAVQRMRPAPGAKLIQRAHASLKHCLVVFDAVHSLGLRRLVLEA